MGYGAPAERRRPGWSQILPPPLRVRLPSTLLLWLPLLSQLCRYLRCLLLVRRRVLLCRLVITWWSEAIMWWPLLSLWVSSPTTCTTTIIRLFNISTFSCHVSCISRKMFFFKPVFITEPTFLNKFEFNIHPWVILKEKFPFFDSHVF